MGEKGEIPKEKLAAIIELIGELPEEGVFFRAEKDGQQYEFAWGEENDVLGNAERCGMHAEVTGMILEIGDTHARVLQINETGGDCPGR